MTLPPSPLGPAMNGNLKKEVALAAMVGESLSGSGAWVEAAMLTEIIAQAGRAHWQRASYLLVLTRRGSWAPPTFLVPSRSHVSGQLGGGR